MARSHTNLVALVTAVLFATFSTYASACALHCAMSMAGAGHTDMHAGDRLPAYSQFHIVDKHAKPDRPSAMTDGPLCHCIAIGQPSAAAASPWAAVATDEHSAFAHRFASHITDPPEPLPKT